MIDGLYSGAAAMQVLDRQHDIVAANLMNLNTVGHKRQHNAVTQLSPDPSAQGREGRFGPLLTQTQVDYSSGPTEVTERPLDTSITGDGFFVVDTPDGERYTKDGRFYRNPETSELVNILGFPIQGENGPIQIPANVSTNDIKITTDGQIASGGQTLGQLKLVAFEDNRELVAEDNSFFRAGPNAVTTDSEATIQQYQLEKSNVNAVQELITLIVSTRQYEAVQKATRGISEALRDRIRT